MRQMSPPTAEGARRRLACSRVLLVRGFAGLVPAWGGPFPTCKTRPPSTVHGVLRGRTGVHDQPAVEGRPCVSSKPRIRRHGDRWRVSGATRRVPRGRPSRGRWRWHRRCCRRRGSGRCGCGPGTSGTRPEPGCVRRAGRRGVRGQSGSPSPPVRVLVRADLDTQVGDLREVARGPRGLPVAGERGAHIAAGVWVRPRLGQRQVNGITQRSGCHSVSSDSRW